MSAVSVAGSAPGAGADGAGSAWARGVPGAARPAAAARPPTRPSQNGPLFIHVPPDRWMFLRYEDFATQPRAAVARILAFLGEDGEPPFVDDETVVLGVNHTVAGNPNRFRVGRVQVRLDGEWSRRMPRYRQLA